VDRMAQHTKQPRFCAKPFNHWVTIHW
jgi:hypothetical protein